MSTMERVFEVEVIVPDKSGHRQLKKQWGDSQHESRRRFHKDLYLVPSTKNVYHIPARTHDQAFDKARKYGRPVSVHKLDKDKIFGNIEQLVLSQPQYGENNLFESPIAMDSMIWLKRKQTGAERRENNLVHDHLDK